jgi:hypothetical protein
MNPLMILLDILVFTSGVALIAVTLISAVRTLVLPRGDRDLLAHLVFRLMWILFDPPIRLAKTYERRDRIMALYAPLTLMLLPVTWLILVLTGYMLIYWAVGIRPLAEAFLLSGSSLFTLGFAHEKTTLLLIFIFSESAIGLGTLALLIAYLPTMYNSFSRREEAVSMLEVRAGTPPSAEEWIKRGNRNDWLKDIGLQLQIWETWFAVLEESHTSFSPLIYFRSPEPDRSWITASGAVLDTAALMLSVVDLQFDRMNAMLCLRAGFLALMRISEVCGLQFDRDPHFPEHPISISREEFNMTCSSLIRDGVPLKPDIDQAWHDFAGWRVNYDEPLLSLAALIRAPYAPWSSDRSLRGMHVAAPG